MDAQESALPLRVRHEGIGLTIETSILLGDALLVRYLSGTRHREMADEVAQAVLQRALGPLLAQAAQAEGCTVGTDYYGEDAGL